MMLSWRDESIIRTTIERRFDSLDKVKILEIKQKRIGDALRVGILLDVDDLKYSVGGLFELPLQFDKRQLLNEIDEIAEGIKTARIHMSCSRVRPTPLSFELPGTGLRGRWKQTWSMH